MSEPTEIAREHDVGIARLIMQEMEIQLELA